MKKIVSLILITATLFLFAGCKKTDKREARMTIGSSVPTSCLFDVRGACIETLETDDYGRELIIAPLHNSKIYDSFAAAVIILQKYDTHVYYYDDVFYFIHKSEAEKYSDFKMSEISNDRIKALKKANDWQKPLNESKMVKKENALKPNGHILNKLLGTNYATLTEKVSKKIGIDEKYINVHSVDNDNKELSLCIAYVDDGQGAYTAYLVITDKSYNVKIELLEDYYDYNEQVRNFKISCGWKY